MAPALHSHGAPQESFHQRLHIIMVDVSVPQKNCRLSSIKEYDGRTCLIAREEAIVGPLRVPWGVIAGSSCPNTNVFHCSRIDGAVVLQRCREPGIESGGPATGSLMAPFKAHWCLNWTLVKHNYKDSVMIGSKVCCVRINSSNLMIASIHSLLSWSKGHWFLRFRFFILCENYTHANSMQTLEEPFSSGTWRVDVFHIMYPTRWK